MMKPIHTVGDFDAATAARAVIEFTARGDAYNLPASHEAGSGGWITPSRNWRKDLKRGAIYYGHFLSGAFRLRAFYPDEPKE